MPYQGGGGYGGGGGGYSGGGGGGGGRYGGGGGGRGGRGGGRGGGGGGRYSDEGDTDPNAEQFRKLFVGGLSYETNEDGLRTHFETWGEIVDCVVMRDPNTKRSRGFGFITYKDSAMIDEAQAHRPHKIDNREVETKRAMPRDAAGTSNHQSVKKMFIGGMKDDTTEEHIREVFSPFGAIESVDIVTDKNTGKVRGFAFVTFEDYDSVDKAVLKKRHDLNGRKVEVKKAVSKDQMEGSSRGGGMSGRGRGRGDSFGGGYAANGGGGGYGGGYGSQGWGGSGGGYGDYNSNWGGGGGGGGFGSNYGGDYGGGPIKGSGGYSARGQGPYGGGYGPQGGGGYGGDFITAIPFPYFTYRQAGKQVVSRLRKLETFQSSVSTLGFLATLASRLLLGESDQVAALLQCSPIALIFQCQISVIFI
ncbi:Heteroproteinous nuclear ribonucleoprotein 87F [Bulinus truncatus]|nr:Heteroproteinous nuclear ribonucleoprotein 87F [Bulinus truncatus]